VRSLWSNVVYKEKVFKEKKLMLLYSQDCSVFVCMCVRVRVKRWNRYFTLILRVREYLPWQVWKTEILQSLLTQIINRGTSISMNKASLILIFKNITGGSNQAHYCTTHHW
jgi:hypothetical protein